MVDSPEIYCILCPSFHGATLVSLVLGNHSRLLGLGDTIPNDVFPTKCGCNANFDECGFWTDVRAATQAGDGRDLFPSTTKLLPHLYLNFAAVVACGIAASRAGMRFPRRRFARSFETFLAVCSKYEMFDIFIDGFKRPDHYVALKASGFPVRGVIHILRDPRSYAAAAKRAGVPAVRAAHRWRQFHRSIDLVGKLMRERVFRLRYEDLCASPDRELESLQSWIGVRPEPIQRPISKSVHWLGNISMSKFDGRITLRVSWPETLTAGERAAVEKITARDARGYGYHF
jgi:hypothetical protein